MKRKIIVAILIFLVLCSLGLYYFLTVPHITLEGKSIMEVTIKDGYKEPGATAKF